ncbi:MAG: FAD-binding oxidoreductase [Deltaproteobacteria bacterium]|nr:FAD-binding oxidoreductase [Deltaproteobacteria bacterium]
MAIIGGGVMGSATAYYLTASDLRLKVAVIEQDPTFAQASSSLSVANVRVQFSLKENILVSLYAFEALERFAQEMAVEGERPEIAFCREGNLFLRKEPGRAEAEAARRLQQSLGGRVEWWDGERIKAAYPLYDLKGLAGGTFSPADGHLDAYAVLMGFRAKARSLGAKMIKGQVTRLLTAGGRATGVELASGETIRAGAVVNCAGAWAAQVAETAGVVLPIDPVKRQVFVLDTRIKPEGPLPLTVLPSGMYFRTETGGLILLGKSLAEDEVGFSFTWDRERFMETLWFELAEFVPAWESLRLVRGWAGLYAVNRLDSNAILGEWPELKGFFLANGFSGHGLQQAPAVGRYISELILGRRPALDLSVFNPARILENRPISESALV